MGLKDLFKKKSVQQMGPKKKILILEDNRQTAQIMKDELEGSGFETVTVFDVSDALLAINEEKFDLIITDILMPELNGFDFLEKLKVAGNTIPVVAITNLNREENEARARELGVVDFLSKTDFSLEKLAKKIKKILGMK